MEAVEAIAYGAAGLNLAVAAILVASRPRNDLNLALGTLFLLNGLAAIYTSNRPEHGVWGFFDPPTGWVILYLGLTYPTPAADLRRGTYALLCGAPALAYLVLALWVAPFVANPTFAILTQGFPLMAGYTVLIYRFTRHALSDASPILRHQAGLLLGAIGLRAGELGLAVGRGAVTSLGLLPYVHSLWWVGIAALTAWSCVQLARRARVEPHARLPVALLAGGLALGASYLANPITLLPPALQGLAMAFTLFIVRPVVVTYALLRYQLLGLHPAVRGAALAVAGAVGLLVAFLAVKAAAATALPGTDPVLLDALGLGALLAAAVAAQRLGLLHRVLHPQGPNLAQEKLDVYRAELEDAVRHGRPGPLLQDPLLTRLRRRAGISAREHAVLEYAVRSATRPRAGPLAGRYERLQALGAGTFGQTHLCRDRATGDLVAVKELLPYWVGNEEAIRSFEREVAVLRSLDHPRVVRLRDSVLGPDQFLLVMEYAAGGSLEQRLSRGPLPAGEAVVVATDVLDALEAAHARGVVHRDVKAANVLLADGRAQLSDFGVARAEQGDRTLAGLGQLGHQPGTLLTMAPEQVAGGRVGAAADVYAVGALMVSMLTGRHYLDPLPGAEGARREAILRRAPRLDGVPPALRPILAKALAKDPARRYRSAAAMARALQAAARPPLSPRGTGGGSSPRRPRPR